MFDRFLTGLQREFMDFSGSAGSRYMWCDFMEAVLLRKAIDLHRYRTILINLGLISAGCVVYALGMNAVLIPSHFLSGGLVGIALLLNQVVPGPDVAWTLLLLNFPLALLGWRTLSRGFMLYSIFGMFFFSVAASWITPAPLAIDDPLLAALVCGAICGVGCGLTLMSVGSAGGLDILTIYLKKKYDLPLGKLGFGINSAILLAGIFLYDVQAVLYSVVFLFVNGRVTDAVLTGMNRKKSMLIVSDRSTDVSRVLLEQNRCGATLLKAEGAYSQQEKNVIFSIASSTDIPRLKRLILETDPDAFIVVNETSEVLGRRQVGGLV